MDDFESDDRIRVIVVSGEGGRAFSSGADISQFEQKRGSPDAIEVYNRQMNLAYRKLTDVSKPTIARIAGYCIGGGLATALCCDLRIASDDSRFGIPAARLGLGYGYGRLKTAGRPGRSNPRQGNPVHCQTVYRGRSLRHGLVNRVLTRDELDGFVDEYTRTIADNAPLTIKACKQIIAEISKDPDHRDLDLCKRLVDACYASRDYKEGRKAFMQKRKLEFQGK